MKCSLLSLYILLSAASAFADPGVFQMEVSAKGTGTGMPSTLPPLRSLALAFRLP
jgi:hypothetical protein